MTTTTSELGECQVCGRFQKVSKHGRLARHGYSLRGLGLGSSGTCRGSGHKPAATGAVTALDALLEFAERNRKASQDDLIKFAEPGYEWGELTIPARAIAARKAGIENARQLAVFATRRRAELIARQGA